MYSRPPYQDVVEKQSSDEVTSPVEEQCCDEERLSSSADPLEQKSTSRGKSWRDFGISDRDSWKSIWARFSNTDNYRPSTTHSWPSPLQIITYLVAITIIGYTAWTLGAKFTHQQDLWDLANSRLEAGYQNNVPSNVDRPIADVHTTPLDEPASQKYAFAAFLAEWSPDNAEKKNDTDMYFIQTRILTYQFLYDPITRTDPNVDFIVLVMPNVDDWKKEQLKKDGAKVVEVKPVESKVGWHKGRWKDLFSKFHVFTLTQYDKICFLDADTTLVAPMTEIFNDPGARIRKTGHNASAIDPEEAPLPHEYLMAGNYEDAGHVARHRHGSTTALSSRVMPRSQDASSHDYFNAGFLVIKPSMAIYNYYLSVLNRPKGRKFNPLFEEQNLWNYAHRREGNIPWTNLHWDWNVHGPADEDLHYGVKSLHGRLWISTGDKYEFWKEKKALMENYFEWMEETKSEELEEESFELESGYGIEDEDDQEEQDSSAPNEEAEAEKKNDGAGTGENTA